MAQCLGNDQVFESLGTSSFSVRDIWLRGGGMCTILTKVWGTCQCSAKKTWDSCLVSSGVRAPLVCSCVGDCDLVLGVPFWNCCFPQSFERNSLCLVFLGPCISVLMFLQAPTPPTKGEWILRVRSLGLGEEHDKELCHLIFFKPMPLLPISPLNQWTLISLPFCQNFPLTSLLRLQVP